MPVPYSAATDAYEEYKRKRQKRAAPMRGIKLVCLNCKRTMDYGRDIDPSIPLNVARIEQPSCDECWDGDREEETWYDAAGNEVPFNCQ